MDIEKITLPNGATYNIKDSVAREQIATITSGIGGGMNYKGVTTTKLIDGSTKTTIVINNSNYTPVNGDIVIYEDREFIFATIGSTSTWHEFGSTGSLHALAFKDIATADYTPGGTISTPSFTGREKNVTVSGSTPLNFILEAGVSNIINGTVNPLIKKEGDTNIVFVTPTAKATGVDVTLNTTTVNSINSVGALPQWNASVNGETLVFSWNNGSLPTTIEKTVATGVDNVTQPTITCGDIGIRIKNMTATMTSTGSYVPEGTNSTPIFTGTPQTITVK